MVIKKVTVRQLRCHTETVVECAPRVTILNGPNGSGKTSILEAVSLCSLGRSFVPVPDVSIIKSNADGCSAVVDATSDNEIPYTVKMIMQIGQRKKYTTNHENNVTTRNLIGAMPVVALSPDHKAITFGGPSERRNFIDAVMAQSSTSVTNVLYDHRRALKQRNALLASQTTGNSFSEWTRIFVEKSAELVERRAEFIKSITPLVQEEYAAVSGGVEGINIQYEPDHIDTSAGQYVEQFMEHAVRLYSAETQRGTSLFGPQKDEITFLINGGLVRETASQGQHKSLLVALKLAECRLIMEHRRELPIVLLDDVFSELDQLRSAKVVQRILEMKMQCFVTTTNAEAITELESSDESHGAPEMVVIEVHDGKIVNSTPASLRWKGAA